MQPLLNDALKGDNLDKVMNVSSVLVITLLISSPDPLHFNLLDLFERGRSVFRPSWHSFPGFSGRSRGFESRDRYETCRSRGERC